MTVFDLGDMITMHPNHKNKYNSLSADILEFGAVSATTLEGKRNLLRVLGALVQDIKSNNNLNKYKIKSASDYAALVKRCPSFDAVTFAIGPEFRGSTSLDWDIIDNAEVVDVPIAVNKPQAIPTDILIAAGVSNSVLDFMKSSNSEGTPKEHLYLAVPTYPRLSDVLAVNTIGANGKLNQMYTSLPRIPKTQNEISITTNPNELTDKELLALFPTNLIHTRHESMYTPIDGLDYDEDLGVIFKFKGFTKKQIIANLIEYPHLFQIKRAVVSADGKLMYENFEAKIEVDGELFDTIEHWDMLPDTKHIPNTAQYRKEYVIRRYLLERDYKNIEHTSSIAGDLSPFLTLFADTKWYKQRGYTNLVDMARKCVNSRILYRASRNGVMQNKGISNCVFAPFCFDLNCSGVCNKQWQHDYLLDLNRLYFPLSCANFTDDELNKGLDILDRRQWLRVVKSKNPKETGDFLTYLAICNQWRGSSANSVVYHLNFSNYAELIKVSSPWDPPESLQYMKIWSRGEDTLKSGKQHTLIISGLDFVPFNDSLSSELLQLITNRQRNNCKTVVILNDVNRLVGKDSMFSRLKEFLESNMKKFGGEF